MPVLGAAAGTWPIREILHALFHLPCLFHWLTGYYCPGCGGTRAVVYLLHGQIAESFRYHPLVPYAAAVIGLELLTALIARWTKNPRWYLGHEKFFLYLAIGIVAVNWIFKNYMLAVHGIDLMPVTL